MLVSSLGRGEKYTGKLVSDHFPAPDEIVFRLAGHNGFPNEDDHGKNRIRLVLLDTGKVIQEATPPRNDVAKLVKWNTRDVQGRDVRIECIDNDSASAYAWIAFGEFQPSWIRESRSVMAMEQALQWIARLGLDETADKLESLLRQSDFSRLMKVELARTLASLRQDHDAVVVLGFMGSSDASRENITQAVNALLDADDDALTEATKLLCKRLSSSAATRFRLRLGEAGCQSGELDRDGEAGLDQRRGIRGRKR